MARFVANVDITTETWGASLIRLNTVLDSLSKEIITANDSIATTGNTSTPRNAQLVGRFAANSVYVYDAIGGGSNATSQGNLTVTSNLVVTGTTLNSVANLFVTANSIIIRSNTTVNAISIVANTTNTNTSIGGADLNINANVAVNDTVFTVTANSQSLRLIS